MEVLAYNHDTKSEMQFDNINQFNAACRWAKLELIDDKYVSASVIDDIEVEEIKVENIPSSTEGNGNYKIPADEEPEIIAHKDELAKYTVPKFRAALKEFSDKDLETFIKFDTRKTIKNEATKELKKRNR